MMDDLELSVCVCVCVCVLCVHLLHKAVRWKERMAANHRFLIKRVKKKTAGDYLCECSLVDCGC